MSFLVTWPVYIGPLIVGLPALFQKGSFTRAAALFTLKPILSTPLWVLISFAVKGIFVPTLLPGLLLALILIYCFRHLFRTDLKSFLLLIGMDVIRWLTIFLICPPWAYDSIGGCYTDNHSVLLIGFLTSNLYAVIVFALLIVRSRRLK